MVLKNKSVDVFKVALMLAVLVMGMVAAPGLAASGSGDITVTAEDADGDYSGDLVLYDSNDNVIETLTADSGEVTFEGVEHGDYYVEGTNSSGATVQSQTFTHENDVTNVDWNISDNSLTVDGEDGVIDYVAPTQDNVGDFLQNPSIGAFLGMVLIGAVWLGFLGLSAFILMILLSKFR